MTNVPYNTNIPFATNNPSEDQPRMQENTNSLKSLIEIDHVGFGQTQGGYHKDIHQPFRVGDPAAVLNVGQVYVKNVTENSATDTQLFFRTGGGGVSQLTGSASLLNGFQHIGANIIQWGRYVSPGTGIPGSGNISFPINFPTACFNVQMTATGVSTSPQTLQVVSISNGGFSWTFTTTSSNSYTGFFWQAIGW